MEGGRGRNNFRSCYARDYINCPPNLQHLPMPMVIVSATYGIESKMSISVMCAYLLPSIDTATISLNKVYAVLTTAAHKMMSMAALDERQRCLNKSNFSNQ